MNYDIKPRQTNFNNREFRSRLEAKWACFFELVGWDYEYEPCQINGFNPDFLIKCSSDRYDCKFVIVEVKPEIMITEEYKQGVLKKYKNQKAHILILSDFPFREKDSYIVIGVGTQYPQPPADAEMMNLEMKCIDDFGSSWMSFDGMIYGEVERKSFLRARQEETNQLIDTWKEAGNRVMFKM